MKLRVQTIKSATVLAALVVLAIALALATALVQQFAKSAPPSTPTLNATLATPQPSPSPSPSPSPQAPAASPQAQAGPLTEAQVLYIAAQSSLVQQFIAENASYRIFFLNASVLAELALEKPVVYADLNVSEAYEVRFATEKYGLLVLVGGGRVLRELPVLGMQLDIITR